MEQENQYQKYETKGTHSSLHFDLQEPIADVANFITHLVRREAQ
jgi:hypothetical protein